MFSLKISTDSLYILPISPNILGGHPIKLELAKYYKDSEMTAYISERSRNTKELKKYVISESL